MAHDSGTEQTDVPPPPPPPPETADLDAASSDQAGETVRAETTTPADTDTADLDEASRAEPPDAGIETDETASALKESGDADTEVDLDGETRAEAVDTPVARDDERVEENPPDPDAATSTKTPDVDEVDRPDEAGGESAPENPTREESTSAEVHSDNPGPEHTGTESEGRLERGMGFAREVLTTDVGAGDTLGRVLYGDDGRAPQAAETTESATVEATYTRPAAADTLGDSSEQDAPAKVPDRIEQPHEKTAAPAETAEPSLDPVSPERAETRTPDTPTPTPDENKWKDPDVEGGFAGADALAGVGEAVGKQEFADGVDSANTVAKLIGVAADAVTNRDVYRADLTNTVDAARQTGADGIQAVREQTDLYKAGAVAAFDELRDGLRRMGDWFDADEPRE